MKKQIVLIGGGGHARVLIDLISVMGVYEIAGIMDNQLEPGLEILSVPVLGGDDLLPALIARGIHAACIAVGSIKDNSKRRDLFKMIKDLGMDIPELIHPGAVVSALSTSISEGAQVMAGAVIQAGSRIGENSIINSGAVIEHDCTIGRNVHICPGAVICGGNVIGDNSFIGAGATVIQSLEIGRDSVVGAGALVYRSLPEGALARGK